MGGEGHMLDMIRRLKEGRDSSRLRRERTNERMKRLHPRKRWDALSVNQKRKKRRTTVISYSEPSSS